MGCTLPRSVRSLSVFEGFWASGLPVCRIEGLQRIKGLPSRLQDFRERRGASGLQGRKTQFLVVAPLAHPSVLCPPGLLELLRL